MTTIKSRRHLLTFYAVLFFYFCLFAIGSLFMYGSANMFKIEQQVNLGILLFVIGFVFYTWSFYTLFTYWKNSPTITINNHIIRVRNKTYNLNDIKELKLTGKIWIPYFRTTYPKEGATILFNDGTKKIIFDDTYENSWEIKSFIEQTVIKKQDYKPLLVKKQDRNVNRYEINEKFKDSLLTSLTGISFLGIIGMIVCFMIISLLSAKIEIFIGIGFIGICMYVFFSGLMYNFEISESYLTVKNHILFWFKKNYLLSDIKEVVFEYNGKYISCMRVITKDFKSKLYWADILKDKTWLEMKSKFEAKGVKVRNEIILEE